MSCAYYKPAVLYLFLGLVVLATSALADYYKPPNYGHKPPVPIYKPPPLKKPPPVPVYKPPPFYKPPIVKKPPPVPVYKRPPFYKPPIVKKPPPVPVYKPPPFYKPPIVKKPPYGHHPPVENVEIPIPRVRPFLKTPLPPLPPLPPFVKKRPGAPPRPH